MKLALRKCKVPGKPSLVKGIGISSTSIICHICFVIIIPLIFLSACGPVSETPVSPSFDSNLSIESKVASTIESSNLLDIKASRLVIVGANGGLLTGSQEVFVRQDHPNGYGFYWDYNVASELLAYATKAWHSTPENSWSVSDFWSYDYQNNVAVRWWSSDVGRVLWDPSSNQFDARAALIVFNADNGDFSLGIANRPGRFRILVDHVGYAFSWSPDGAQIAFVRQANDPGIYVLDTKQTHVRQISDFSYGSNGWIFDKPLWILDKNLLVVADNGSRPLLFVDLHGKSEFVPTSADGRTIPGPRPNKMLWSPSNDQLIISGDSGTIVETWVHSFTENMRVAQNSVNLGDALLAGWWEAGESVILIRRDGTEIYVLPKS